MNAQAKHTDTHHNPPEISREQGDIEESGRGHSEEDGGQAGEDEEGEGIAGQIAACGGAPIGMSDAVPVEDRRLDPVDQHAPES